MAENLDSSPVEKGQQDQQQPSDKIDERKFTPTEVRRLQEKHVSIPYLARERNQLKSAAEAEMKDLLKGKGQTTSIISNKEYRALQQELDDTESPELTQKILDKLRDLPRLKEEAAQREKDEKVELDPEDPKLLDLQKQFDKICDENRELIGDRQIAGFKAWLAAERKNKPTIGHLKDHIARLEGKDIADKNGLAPRRVEYETLRTLFKKYGFSSPQESSWIKKEGLSERQQFRKQIEDLEEHFEKVKDTGFYSPEMIKARMRENLKAENPQALEIRLKEAKDIARQESEAFTHMDEHITVNGVTIRKMSEASRKKYMEYYKNLSFTERKKEVTNWQILAENEGGLAKHSDKFSKMYADNDVKALDQIYKDDPEALRLALQSFGELDFMKKIEALKAHEKLANSKKTKEQKETELTLQAANAKIDTAATKDIISEKTRVKYRAFFANPDNFKNPQTQKPGDLKELKKAYEILASDAPQEKYKNLAAYETRRKAYQKDLNRLREINPNLSDEEIKKWQDKYDREGWTKRTIIHQQELHNEITKQQAEKNKRRELQEKAGMKETDEKDKKKETNPRLAETIKAVTELISNDQGAEAMKALLEFNDHEPDNPKILFWMQTVANYIKEFGSGKKREKTVEKELEKELERTAESDENLKRELTEQQVKTLGIQGAKQSEQRHDQNISAEKRAQKESMGRVQAGSLEADLTADAYKQMGEGFVVNKEGKAEKVEAIKFKDNNAKMLQEDLVRQKQKTYKEQSKLDTREGLVRSIKDKTGKIVSTRVAEQLQKDELQKLEEKMAAKAEDKVANRVADKPTGKLFDLNTKITARRKAQELIDEKRKAKLKAA